ncbi:MAG: Galactose/methyl galactoside import ATP-binding protein MglA [Firmicutes bacterium ADurb.Bin506]|nr:MAG: Galactose/methyl galactoside import ATP-binding protein MglA [Firmicutes bacterium ADurb.Bin506]
MSTKISGPGVRMSSVVKVYPPDVLALDNVDICISPGSIHSIIGENGAGKSTLMKILAGLETRDAGSIVLDGEPVALRSVRDAKAHGIALIPQERSLCVNLTIEDHLFLGRERARGKVFVDRRGRRERAAAALERWGLKLDCSAIVGDLSISAQQKVEILKLLYRDVQVLIMDEPTAVLTPQETAELFVRLRALNSDGRTIIFISHRLSEVLDISDEITVMRRGRRVMTTPNRGLSRADLARAMVGRDVVFSAVREGDAALDSSQRPPQPSPPTVPPCLEVRGLSMTVRGRGRPVLDDVSLEVRGGEIVGIAGVEGNGQFELVQAITGAVKPDSGSILMSGQDVTGASVMSRRRLMCSVPQDRKLAGGAGAMSLVDNSIMTHHRLRPSLSSKLTPLLLPRACRDFCARLIAEYSVVASGPDAALSQLSGGNQQKVIVGREFSHDVDLVLLDNPTRGLDVGSSEFIHAQILKKRSEGKGCLLVSADLDELLSLCDRIIVMYEGRVAAEFAGSEADRDSVGRAMLGLGPGPGRGPESEGVTSGR